MKKLFPSNSLKTLLICIYTTVPNHNFPKLSSKSSLLYFSALQNHFLLWAWLNHDADVGIQQWFLCLIGHHGKELCGTNTQEKVSDATRKAWTRNKR